MDPKEVLNNPENIKLLIGLLQSLLTDDQNSEPEAKPEAKVSKSKVRTKSRQRGKSQDDNEESDNKFSRMPEFSMHKEDSSVDKQLSKHPPVARMREFELVQVTCRICGKTETVSPGLVFEGSSRYKCNNCSTQAG